MNEGELLILGLLMTESRHGYGINEFIERNLSRVTDMKKPTAYATLERLCRQGYVRVRTEQEGNRPPRKVYAVTPSGEAYFEELLHTNLAQADRLTLGGDIGLMFLDHALRHDALALLRQRLDTTEARLAEMEHAPRHRFGLGVDLAIEHHALLLAAERDWLAGLVRRLGEPAPPEGPQI